jgi:hypothetical protein
MKNLLKLVMVVCLMFAVGSLQAQTKFGIKGGLNMSTMTFKMMGITVDPKSLMGFHFGAIAEMPLSGNLFVQPGIFYSSKGSKFEVGTEKFQANPTFIDIPINLLYKLDLGSARLVVNAGPYLAYGISGDQDFSTGTKEAIKWGSNAETDMMKPMDYGLNFGAGVELSSIIISVNYGLGLSNLSPESSVTFKNKVIGISVAYMFGGK